MCGGPLSSLCAEASSVISSWDHKASCFKSQWRHIVCTPFLQWSCTLNLPSFRYPFLNYNENAVLTRKWLSAADALEPVHCVDKACSERSTAHLLHLGSTRAHLLHLQ